MSPPTHPLTAPSAPGCFRKLGRGGGGNFPLYLTGGGIGAGRWPERAAGRRTASKHFFKGGSPPFLSTHYFQRWWGSARAGRGRVVEALVLLAAARRRTLPLRPFWPRPTRAALSGFTPDCVLCVCVSAGKQIPFVALSLLSPTLAPSFRSKLPSC